MPRFYVKNTREQWNIYSTIVDDLLFEKFMSFDDLKKHVIQEVIETKEEELKTLLTDKPLLNVMDFNECIENLKIYNRKIPKD